MLIMITYTDNGITRIDRPTIKKLDDALMQAMILEESFNKPIEEIQEVFRNELADVFSPTRNGNVAIWLDPATEATYTFILV